MMQAWIGNTTRGQSPTSFRAGTLSTTGSKIVLVPGRCGRNGERDAIPSRCGMGP
jgi:hypothetical protein